MSVVRGLLAGVCLLTASASASELPPQAREFDFWLGAWDVNLRIRSNGAWPASSVRAKAEIYSVLDGKAVLELWNSAPIKGFSLRYFDVEQQKWLLWLNWPGPNRSGSTGLSGSFHHGRGNFFSETQIADGKTQISRYSFNDITPTSLRWDDAYSTDGGETWRHQWIMEFSRTAPPLELDPTGGDGHTQGSGGRCTLEQFRRFDPVVGRHRGTVERRVQGSWQSVPAVLTGYRVLDDCVVLAVVSYQHERDSFQSFHQLTWNTFASAFEETVLDSSPESPMMVYFGQQAEGELTLARSPAFGEEVSPSRRVWRFTDDHIEIEVLTPDRDAQTWSTVSKAQFVR